MKHKSRKQREPPDMIIDMRSPVEFRDSTIPTAVNMNLRQLSSVYTTKDKTIAIAIFGDADTTNAAVRYLHAYGFANVTIISPYDPLLRPRKEVP